MSFLVREVHRMRRERQLLIAQKSRAESAYAAEAARNEDLLLAQARRSSESDPTTAVAWLKRLRPETQRGQEAREIAELAAWRGVAAGIFAGLAGPVRALAFDPQGARLAAADEGRVLLWEVRGGGPRSFAAPLTGRLLFSPDGRLLLAGGEWGVRVIELRDGAMRTLSRDGAARPAPGLSISPDGASCAVGGADGAVLLFSLISPAGDPAVLRGPGPDPVRQVLFSPAGKVLAVRDRQGIEVLPIGHSPEHLIGRRLPSAGTPGDNDLSFSRDGRFLSAPGPGGTTVWSMPAQTTAPPAPRRVVEEGTVVRAVLSPDGAHLGSANGDGTVRWWDLNGAAKNTVLSHRGAVALDLLLSADGRKLAATRGPMVRVWTLPGGEPKKLRGAEQDVERLALSPDGSLLAAGSHDGALRLWVIGEGPAAALLAAGRPKPIRTSDSLHASDLPTWLHQATGAILDDKYRLSDESRSPALSTTWAAASR